jgi:hypothetical protein
MRLLQWFACSGRALAALVLLATLVAGEVADAHHHLEDTACTAESSGGPERDDHCTCANLHAVSLAEPASLAHAPVALEREFTAFAPVRVPADQVRSTAPPRAPPIG